MFNFAYQLELLLTAAKPPLYLSEKTINRQGPRYICLEGKPGGWLFRFLLSLIGLAPAPRKVEVYSDRIEYSVNAKWFQSKDKITFSTICSTGHQFFRFPHFLILAWLCFIYGVLTLIPLFQSDDDVATMLIVTGVGLIFAGLIFFWLYFKVQRFIIYVYTNCGKGMLFAFQPRKSFILAPQDAIDTTLEDVDSIMNFLAELIESNKASQRNVFSSSLPAQTPRAQKTAYAQNIAQRPASQPFFASGQSVADSEGFSQSSADQSSFSLNQTQSSPAIQASLEVKYNDYLKKCLDQLGCSHISELVNSKTPLSQVFWFKKAMEVASPDSKQKLTDIQNAQKEKIDKAKTKSNIILIIAVLLVILFIVGIVLYATN